ncbi:nucleotidyltransferase family protein [Tenacibaculum sp. MEBiC06402]|uniref:nucleotidyltransferase family protein n=1 Tax=unclassified Tenacibaculum TaxID=2635139 RepID=UPI003B98F6A7
MRIATLILAAGSSTRMGKTKQILSFGNTTLLGKVIEATTEVSNNDIFCVLGANSEEISLSIQQYDINIILNKEFETGLSSSIYAGIAVISKLNFDAVIIVLGDQPNVSSNYLQHMMKISEENKSKIIASNYNGRNGVPALFPKKYFKDLLLLKGDKGASKLLNSDDFPIFTMKGDVDLFDVDTESDYNHLIRKKI